MRVSQMSIFPGAMRTNSDPTIEKLFQNHLFPVKSKELLITMSPYSVPKRFPVFPGMSLDLFFTQVV